MVCCSPSSSGKRNPFVNLVAAHRRSEGSLSRRLGRRQRTSVIASQPDRRNLGRRRPASPRQPPRRRAAFFRRQSLRRQLSGAASISSLVFSRSQPPRPFASSSPSIAYSRRQRPLTASASSSPPSPVFAPACSVQPVAQWSAGAQDAVLCSHCRPAGRGLRPIARAAVGRPASLGVGQVPPRRRRCAGGASNPYLAPHARR